MSLSNHPFHTDPLVDILAFLLKQLRRPLLAHGLSPFDGNEGGWAQRLMGADGTDTALTPLHKALLGVLQESEDQLAQWGMTFAQSLATPMGDMKGWETTAEFLELATLKSNAELRIASVSLVLIWLDALRCRPHLEFIALHPDYDELNSIVAQRILQHLEEKPHPDDSRLP
ncbi:MAG: hypothetical protein ACOYLB_00415 [Phototrophicaceae bacterium]